MFIVISEMLIYDYYFHLNLKTIQFEISIDNRQKEA